MLAELMFISLVLFQFGCFDLSLETFKQFTPKGYTMYVFWSNSTLCESHEMPSSVVCSKHAFMPS